MDQSQAFGTFDKHLNLDPDERKAAETLHRELTDYLVALGLIVKAFLQGSLARKTMRPPLHDVDKVVILPASSEAAIRARWGGPDAVMDSLEQAISRRYPGTRFERKKHALSLQIPGYSFHFDVVPAFEIAGHPDGDILIANREATDLEGQWKRSNTRKLIDVVATRNQDCRGAFIHWVRMGKEMAAIRIGDGFPGLHMESLCFAANTGPIDHGAACVRLFQTGAAVLGSRYTDPTGVDVISDRLDLTVRLRAQQVFGACAQQAVEAQNYAAAGDHDNACRLWHAIFGDAFPAPAGQTAAQALAASFAGGGITSLGTATPASAAPQVSRPTRSWRP